MSEEMKVTDKRMFTPEGELREEFRHLEEDRARRPEQPPAPPPAPPQAAAPQPDERQREDPTVQEQRTADAAAVSSQAQGGSPRVEMPVIPPEMGGPSFFDLVGLIAEPVAIYLGDVELPDGQSAENLEAARFHIDLLDVLRQKAMGNLSSEEMAVLEDVLYRLRLRYVQKRG